MTAQSIIDKFRPYAQAMTQGHTIDDDGNEYDEWHADTDEETHNAILCSIVYVEGLIELNKCYTPMHLNATGDALKQHFEDELTALLNELKAMV